MASAPAPTSVKEPFPISCIAGRYLLFDVDVIAHCRREHNICGVLIGTIPNLSQQNVFLGIPLELMPEEARVLVENGSAFIVDDVQAHRTGFGEMSREDRLKYLQEMDKRGAILAREQLDKAERKKDRALKDKGLKADVPESSGKGLVGYEGALRKSASAIPVSSGLGFIMKGSAFSDSQGAAQVEVVNSHTQSLFDTQPLPVSMPKESGLQKHYITPTTSRDALLPSKSNAVSPLPPVPNSYPLFRYLHSKGYFHMPGIRFGCHYNVYPGDPLRYHSHFAATGLAWDQEFDLLDVIGGGRLGTGTKKAYMVGGEQSKGQTRAFSIEWAAL